MNPVVSTGIVTSGDVLRLMFTAILFLGIQAELQADLAALRRANAELRRLATSTPRMPASRSGPASPARSTTGWRRTSGTPS